MKISRDCHHEGITQKDKVGGNCQETSFTLLLMKLKGEGNMFYHLLQVSNNVSFTNCDGLFFTLFIFILLIYVYFSGK